MTIGTGADFVDGLHKRSVIDFHMGGGTGCVYGGVQVDKDGARDVFVAAGLCKEGLEGAFRG